MCLINVFLNNAFLFALWWESSSASNFGALLSGIGALILALVSVATLVLGSITFTRWRKQNRFSKLSDVAATEFNTINNLEYEIVYWLQYSSFVFNKYSEANQKKLETLPPEKQREYSTSSNMNEFELVNYSKKGNDIMKQIMFAKYRVYLFQDNNMVRSFDELFKLVKTYITNLNIRHFPDMDKQTAVKAIEAMGFEKNQKKVSDLCESIRGALVQYIRFDK